MPRLPIPQSFPGATGSLRKDLERFAGETSKFAESADLLYDARPQVPAPAYSAVAAQFGQLLRVDPQGGVVVVSPPPTEDASGNVLSAEGGRRFEVVIVGAGTVIIRPSSTTIDGATELVVSAQGLVTVRFDGVRFWSSRFGQEQTTRTLEFRGSVTTMSSTFARYVAANDLDLLSATTRNHYTIREPGFAGVARELSVFRFGASAGLLMPTNGPSGVCTGAGNFLYSLEVNGSVRATGSIATGIAQRSFSLVASLAATDQVGVRVQTFSGAQWTGIDSYHHAVVRVS